MTSKTRIFLLTAILLLVAVQPMIVLGNDYRVWDQAPDGVPVRQGFHIEWSRSIAQDADGNLLIAWSDTRLGDRDLYVQLINSDGVPQWGDDGKIIVQEYSRSEDPHVMADGNGNWIVTWIDFRYDVNILEHGDVFMKKIDSDGENVWTNLENGELQVCGAQGVQLQVQSFTDGNGGAVTIWTDNRSENSDLYAQHISADGVVSYEVDGKVIAGGPGQQGSITSWKYTADTDGAGGMIFAWVDLLTDDHNIYVNRLTADGTLAWADSVGQPLCVNPADQQNIKLAPDGNGGAFAIWVDKRDDPSAGDIFGQHISADGTYAWTENGVPVAQADGSQANPRIVGSAQGEAVFTWEDKRNDPIDKEDLYVQKISNDNGTPELHWGPTGDPIGGLALCLNDEVQTQTRLTPDGSGGVYLSWEDLRNSTTSSNDLYGQHVSSNGDLLWGDQDGMVVCDEYLNQGYCIIRSDGVNSTFLWFDERLGSPSVYIQIYDEDGEEVLDHNGESLVYGIDSNALKPLIVDAGDHTLMAWVDGRSGALGKQIYVQKFNKSTGNKVFVDNGISILPGFPYGETDTLDVVIKELTIVSDGAGGLYAGWVDQRFPDYHVFVQHMNSDGSVTWGERGLAVANNGILDDFEQINIQIIPVNNDGILAVYRQSDEGNNVLIRAQHINADGIGQWSGDDGTGIPLHTIDDDYKIETLEKFDDESVLVVYQRYGDIDLDLFAQRINLDGTLDWTTELTLCSASLTQYEVVSQKVDGGIVVAWEDKRVDRNQTDIYAQFINSDGTINWDVNGKSMNSEANEQKWVSIGAYGDSSTNFWLAWQDFRDGAFRDIYAQRFDLNGDPFFTGDLLTGIALGADNHDQTLPTTLVTENDSLWVVWEDKGTASHKDLHYARVNPDGVVDAEFVGTGLVLSAAYHDQELVHIVDDNQNGFIAVWADNRSTGKETISNVYAQQVNQMLATGVSESLNNVPEGWELSDAYPNPFNPSTKIAFKVANASNVKITVYDILGREVTNIVNTVMTAGKHVALWNGKNSSNVPVASGIYFYQLTSENVTITKRMVLMK